MYLDIDFIIIIYPHSYPGGALIFSSSLTKDNWPWWWTYLHKVKITYRDVMSTYPNIILTEEGGLWVLLPNIYLWIPNWNPIFRSNTKFCNRHTDILKSQLWPGTWRRINVTHFMVKGAEVEYSYWWRSASRTSTMGNAQQRESHAPHTATAPLYSFSKIM